MKYNLKFMGIISILFLVSIGCIHKPNIQSNSKIIKLKEPISDLIDLNDSFIIYQNIEGKLVKEHFSKGDIDWVNTDVKIFSIASQNLTNEFVVTDPSSIFFIDKSTGETLKKIKKNITIRTYGFEKIGEESILAWSSGGIFLIKNQEIVSDLEVMNSIHSSASISVTKDFRGIYTFGLGDSLDYEHENVLKLDTNTGEVLNSKRFKGECFSKIASDDKNLYFFTRTGIIKNLISVNKNTFETNWEKDHSITFYNSIFVNETHLFFCDNKMLYAINKVNGTTTNQVKIPPYTDLIHLKNNRILLGNNNSILMYDVNPNNLSLVKELHLRNNGHWVINDVLYVAEKNKLYSYHIEPKEFN